MKDIKITPNSFIKINKNSLFGLLKVSNTSKERKAFKIKTTRPKDYLVKPSIGILEPQEEVVIEINILENYKIDESHKFAVEIYEVNWRQNNETLKRYLKSTQIAPMIIHRLGVEYEGNKIEEHENTRGNQIIPYLCVIYLFIIFLLIIYRNITNNDKEM
ncbi:vesicle-associated membrane protein [Vairimorpha necatrix]|uniref:Vesicle-associated membrane protein n=1 Tax=Vairimorpha necatrix TaxID=6039 RepID=A0AAX4J8H8_9MICR